MQSEFRLMPEQASSLAADVDRLYAFLYIVSGILSALIAILIIFFAIKYRRGSSADRRQGHTHFFAMELSWIFLPLPLTMIMFYWGATLYFEQARPPAGAMEIDCVARQWMWKFQHPEGHSEINDLHVPLGEAVKVNLVSEDVIHSFYVPAFRVKQDVLPHRTTTVWFRPTKVGVYHLFCAEYCGSDHARMGGFVYVMEPRDYQRWLSGQASSMSTADAGRLLLEKLRCIVCHEGGGAASRCPPLTNLFGRTVQLNDGSSLIADENYIRESILRPAAKVVAGYQPVMPSYEGQIGEEGVLQLIAEIKRMSKAIEGRPAEPDSESDEGRNEP